MLTFYLQVHGYKNGHQLLYTDIALNRIDQDTIDRLSDISGPIRPGEVFKPYFTAYPLPSTKYFVVARTWQDLTVQRAGCVVTKSLVIDMAEWEAHTDTSYFFNVLSQSSPNKDEKISASIPNHTEVIPISRTPVNELVESLFLERRQPIVMFNCDEQEQISIRLYQIFWSSLKKTFAICTFALSQRNVGDKLFDLLFAPESARSRFSEWPGRRIDNTNNGLRSPRHRWTAELANRIFSRQTPSLFEERNGLPAFNKVTDEGTFRLSLLWTELLDRAEKESSPMAILGLLDIINSQPIFANELYKKLEPYIINAIHLASKKLEKEDAWKFFIALLAKHNEKLMSRQMLYLVKESCTELASETPLFALSFIQSNQRPVEDIPSVMLAALGDGFADFYASANQPELVNEISPRVGLSMLSNSRKFCKEVIQVTDYNLPLMREFFHRTLNVSQSKLLIKAKRNLSVYINSEEHSFLLALLLNDSTNQVSREIIHNTGKNTGFKFASFHLPLLDAAESLHNLDFLKEEIIFFDKDGNADLLLGKILSRQPNSLKWLIDNVSIAEIRKKFILTVAFQNDFEKFADILSKNSDLSISTIQAYSFNPQEHAEIMASLLMVADISVNSALIALNSLSNESLNYVSNRLKTAFLVKAISTASVEYEDMLIKLVGKISDLDYVNVMESLTSRRNTSQQIISNLRRLLISESSIYQRMAKEADYVSILISDNSKGDLDEILELAWIKLLRNVSFDKDLYRRTAAIILDFSYKSTSFDPTRLIIEAFPIIYKAFQNGKSITQYFSFMFFSDWDKCRTLRENLVYKYMDSHWSPLGLFGIAVAADIVKEIGAILASTKGGKKFIGLALNEGESLNLSRTHPIMQAILKAYSMI